MTKRDEWAFPRSDQGFSETHDGMSLRDYFAAQILPAFLLGMRDKGTTLLDGTPVTMAALANGAYDLADAMLKARTQ